ncbi:hypothetical protein [Leptospira yasudae]|uniref:Uncharacterized protein n=1 Tax=Leptospira yasudae TaxID=2202201 RepID=A0A6N4QZQ4_9LEPT|nr:hypothetical protein [Leptospira yasudae]TGL79182.1 hypothetical protein EHQ72_09290 [Leptospira yasudae]TGL83244.1 hypothetical protein EHQ77_02265 [Leptospira yasudae]TGL85745.1 hypothetical protein EHQ83_07420 [Leptospira yasudae]
MGLLEKAIDRYGGWKLWDRIDSFELELKHLGAPIPIRKGLGKTFPKPSFLKIYPKSFTAEFLEYPSAGKKIVFQNGKVGIFYIQETDFEFEIPDYRQTFRGFRKYRRWNPLDAAYFFGYAITQYVSVPFILKEFGVREVPLADGFRIDAEFPQSMHTHCRKQSYYFNEEGLLTRNDYTADVIGPWAIGAHLTTDYREVDGIPVATRRNVFVRLGKFVTPICVLSAELNPIRVNFR